MEEPTKKEEAKTFNLLEWTTIIYAFLTFLTYSFTDIYYSKWDIDIYCYLDSSEIWLAFLKNTNIITATLIGMFASFMGSIYFYRIKDIYLIVIR